MSYQQPPDDPYNQQTRASWPSQPPSYPPPPQGQPQQGQQQPQQQGQQQWYQEQQQPQQQYYGSGDAQNAWPQQPGGQSAYQAQPGTAGYQAQPATAGYQVQPAQQNYQVQGYQAAAPQSARGGHRQGGGGKQYGLRGAEAIWYVIFCIDFGAAYFQKIPAKKAACEVFSELQLDGQGPSQGYSLNGWESFWYILMCLAFGAGYFAKVWVKKSLWEIVNMMRAAPADQVQALTRALTGSGSGSGSQYPQRF